jgi:hypothetical protein
MTTNVVCFSVHDVMSPWSREVDTIKLKDHCTLGVTLSAGSTRFRVDPCTLAGFQLPSLYKLLMTTILLEEF